VEGVAFEFDTLMAQFVSGMIGPFYVEVDPTEGGYDDYEYDGTAWRLELAHSPMSSDTLCGSVFPSLVMQTLRYEGFGGMDRQCKVFLHNMYWGFMRDGQYRGMGGSSRFPQDVLSVFGLEVGGGVDRKVSPGRFHVVGVRTWMFGGRDGLSLFGNAGSVAVSSFYSALDGTSDGGVVDEAQACLDDMMTEAREVVVKYARARGWDDDVMELINSVSLEDLL